jgi:hypothetical protein
MEGSGDTHSGNVQKAVTKHNLFIRLETHSGSLEHKEQGQNIKDVKNNGGRLRG